MSIRLGLLFSCTNSGMKIGVRTVYPVSVFARTTLTTVMIRINRTTQFAVLTGIARRKLVRPIVSMAVRPAKPKNVTKPVTMNSRKTTFVRPSYAPMINLTVVAMPVTAFVLWLQVQLRYTNSKSTRMTRLSTKGEFVTTLLALRPCRTFYGIGGVARVSTMTMKLRSVCFVNARLCDLLGDSLMEFLIGMLFRQGLSSGLMTCLASMA